MRKRAAGKTRFSAAPIALLAGLLLASPGAAVVADRDGLAAYMTARVADSDADAAQVLRGYAAALAAAPGNADVALRAWREAMAAGDDALADRAAATLAAAGKLPDDAALPAVAAAARGRDPAAVDAAIGRLSAGQLRALAVPLQAYAVQQRGGDPLPLLAQPAHDAIARRLIDETRALILIARRRPDEALAALAPLIGNNPASLDLRIAAAQLLIGQGQVALARGLLVGDSPVVAALRARPEGVKPTLATGAARMFVRLADDLAAGDAGLLSITLTRAALRAEPGNDRARLLLADALARQDAPDRALAVLDAVSADGPYGASAAAGRVAILAGADRIEAAIAAAAPLAAAPDAPDSAISTLGDLLMTADRPRDAAALYARVIDRPGGAANWQAWLRYAAALDGAGDWAGARKALLRALALAPDEPVVLNYLGYGDVTHGGAVKPALAMLEKAATLRPNDAAIVDSLGWAYYRSGAVARAVPLLERAAEASPDNAEIGEHLGDAYWASGRRYEARYAWRAAQATADADVDARLATKIAAGLPAAQ